MKHSYLNAPKANLRYFINDYAYSSFFPMLCRAWFQPPMFASVARFVIKIPLTPPTKPITESLSTSVRAPSSLTPFFAPYTPTSSYATSIVVGTRRPYKLSTPSFFLPILSFLLSLPLSLPYMPPIAESPWNVKFSKVVLSPLALPPPPV